jgi:hypothetical protein
MLVPAMAFAWWIVSMSANGHPAHRRGAPPEGTASLDEIAIDAPRPQAGGERDQASDDANDEASDEARAERRAFGPAPAEPAQDGDESDPTEDTAGERVRLKVVTPAIVRAARSYLDLPMGTAREENIEGRRYVFVLERHYHPPGFVGGPHGWHKGVTAYELR